MPKQQTRDGGAMNRFRLAALIAVGALSLGVLLVLILSVSGPPDAVQARAVDPSPAGSAGQSAAITPAASSGGPKSDSGGAANEVVLPAGETATPNASAAGDAPVHQAESVAVTIHLSGNVDGVVSFLEDHGGSARNVGGDYVEAYVPVSLLGQTSEQPGVLRVRGNHPAPAGPQRLASHRPIRSVTRFPDREPRAGISNPINSGGLGDESPNVPG